MQRVQRIGRVYETNWARQSSSSPGRGSSLPYLGSTSPRRSLPARSGRGPVWLFFVSCAPSDLRRASLRSLSSCNRLFVTKKSGEHCLCEARGTQLT
jgi:hypothetical protein